MFKGLLGGVLGIARALPWWAWLVLGLFVWGSWNKHAARSAAEDAAQAQREAATAQRHAQVADDLRAVADTAAVQTRARAVAVRAAAVAGDGLRVAATDFAASSADPGSCAATAATARVLADLLGRVEARGRRMAEIADERGDAGAACERSFEALSK